MFRKTILSFLLIVISYPVFSQINYSEKTRLNDGWEFLRQDLGSIWEAVRIPAGKDSPETVPLWTNVTLPHCFNAEDCVDPDMNYYQGPGWYKKLLDIENPYKNGRILLQFEGAGQKTDVYIYTEKVGNHVGGYDEWTVDITDAVGRFVQSENAGIFGGKIPLSIRCDNSRDTEMIPSDLSDFNIYGGIYRYLNLVYTPATAFSGIQTEASVDEKRKEGTLNVKAFVINHSQTKDASLSIQVFDPTGKEIAEEKHIINELEINDVLSLKVAKPKLWSPKMPLLYSVKLTLTSSGGTMVCEEKFGFRHFEFKNKGPFFLNGERLLLRGTHRHEDHAGVAAAMTEEQIVKEMEMMKEMGVNFIRLGHYQQSRIVLEECDRLGILVWEEIPWCRGGLGGEVYKKQARRMLTNMITQHRNHPSIILWGLGNENDWPNDFPEFDKEKIQDFMKELHDLSHTLDNTRLTCIRRCDFCKDIVDVYSPTIWPGWYRGYYTQYKEFSKQAFDGVNHFLHVEWGGDSHAGRYDEIDYSGVDKISPNDTLFFQNLAKTSKDKGYKSWNETYICDLIDWHLKEQETMPWLTGAAYWPFKDFSTPVRPENPVPYVNQKGVVERDLVPKEAFYVFRSYWTEDPMIRIFGHNMPVRWGKIEEEKLIKVYSNCEQVELFINGKSLGVKNRNSQDFPAAGLRWNTLLEPGNNTVKAIGSIGKGKNQITVEDEINFDYETRIIGKEATIKVFTTEADDKHVWINAELTDNNGITCLDSNKFIRFESVGDVRLMKNKGTSSGSSKVQVYNGRARIKLAKNNGETIIAVKSEGLKTEFITVR